MNRITFPLKLQMRGPQVADLQDALQLLLERRLLFAGDEGARRELLQALQREIWFWFWRIVAALHHDGFSRGVRMPDYRRNWVPGGTYFFTVALLERRRDLLVTEIERLREAVRRVKRRYPFEIVAWVVLPDHLHCIWTLPPGDADYATRWRLIKLMFVKSLPQGERLSAVRKRRHERGIWQRRYWEHTIRDARDLAAHVDYIHWNPVKHGYVAQVAQWPFSTFHRYVAKGIYPRDWGGSGMHTEGAYGEEWDGHERREDETPVRRIRAAIRHDSLGNAGKPDRAHMNAQTKT